jgi:hypothetical protein
VDAANEEGATSSTHVTIVNTTTPDREPHTTWRHLGCISRAPFAPSPSWNIGPRTHTAAPSIPSNAVRKHHSWHGIADPIAKTQTFHRIQLPCLHSPTQTLSLLRPASEVCFSRCVCTEVPSAHRMLVHCKRPATPGTSRYVRRFFSTSCPSSHRY